jgi:uncharacterized protein DUF4129
LVLVAIPIAMLAGLIWAVVSLKDQSTTEPELVPSIGALPTPPALSPAEPITSVDVWSSFGWVLAVIALLVLAVAAIWFWRERGYEIDAATSSQIMVRAIDDGLGALERETEPRRAVILAYLAMEGALARHGLGRNLSEAPTEYLVRILSHVPGCGDSANRLTWLFEEAKFSQHTIDQACRRTAINALMSIRAALASA